MLTCLVENGIQTGYHFDFSIFDFSFSNWPPDLCSLFCSFLSSLMFLLLPSCFVSSLVVHLFHSKGQRQRNVHNTPLFEHTVHIWENRGHSVQQTDIPNPRHNNNTDVGEAYTYRWEEMESRFRFSPSLSSAKKKKTVMPLWYVNWSVTDPFSLIFSSLTSFFTLSPSPFFTSSFLLSLSSYNMMFCLVACQWIHSMTGWRTSRWKESSIFRSSWWTSRRRNDSLLNSVQGKRWTKLSLKLEKMSKENMFWSGK